MKITLITVAAVSGIVVQLSVGLGPVVVLAFFFGYLLYGLSKSLRRGLDPLNDVPNAFRVLLAALSAYLATLSPNFFGISLAIALFLSALALNDEYQRRALDSVRTGRMGGSVALLGIDGSGKSTHSAALEQWFRQRGYHCTKVPFHRYLFVERLAAARAARSRTSGAERGGNPLRPLLSVVDNLILHLVSSFGRGVEGRVVLYDRYIWSTYVKYRALGYPVRPVRWLYMLPRPRFAVVLDVPVEKSLEVIGSRAAHIRYSSKVLQEERAEYLNIGRRTGFPIVDATREYSSVQGDIERLLARTFPAVDGGR